MKKKYIVISVILVMLLFMTNVCAGEYDVDSRIKNASLGLGGGEELLGRGDEFPAGTSVCDWSAMCLAFSGAEDNYEEYLSELEEYVGQKYAEYGCLDKVKATEYHRIALTVTALGGDAGNFGEKPDATAIDLIADGTYDFAGKSLGAQGLNGYIYALICLDAHNTIIPEDALYSREYIKDAIISSQNDDGGFSLSSGSSEVDMTAMALQALAPYKNEYPEQIEKALDFLAGKMSDECLFYSFGDASCESSAQVILALCALNIDPQDDSRFRRGSADILTQTERYLQQDGTYSHLAGDDRGDYLATTQMLLALISVSKLRNGDGWLFDFGAYIPPDDTSVNMLPVMAAVAAVIATGIIIYRRKRK